MSVTPSPIPITPEGQVLLSTLTAPAPRPSRRIDQQQLMEATVTLASISCTLPLADVYDKVEFDEETAFPKLRLIKEPEVEYITETRLRRPGDPRPATR